MKRRKKSIRRWLAICVVCVMMLGTMSVHASEREAGELLNDATAFSGTSLSDYGEEESDSADGTAFSGEVSSGEKPETISSDDEETGTDASETDKGETVPAPDVDPESASDAGEGDSSGVLPDESTRDAAAEEEPQENGFSDDSAASYADESLSADLLDPAESETALTVTPTPTPTEELVGAAVSVKEGLYMFRVNPNGTTERALAVSGNSTEDYAAIISGTCASSNVRLFYVEKVTATYYRIRSLHSGKYLQVTGNNTADGTLIRQKTGSATSAQHWKFVKSGNGYKIIGRKSGKALNVKGGSDKTGTAIEIRTIANKASQVWYPVSLKTYICGAGTSVSWPSDQFYTGNAVTPDVTLSVYGKVLVRDVDYRLAFTNNTGSGTAKVTVSGIGKYQGKCSGSFTIIAISKTVESGGTYFLLPKVGTSLALTISGTVIKNNVRFSLTPLSNAKSKKFTFLKTTDGSYKLLSWNSLYVFTGQENGTLKLYKQQNAPMQRWTIQRSPDGAFSFLNLSTKQAVTLLEPEPDEETGETDGTEVSDENVEAEERTAADCTVATASWTDSDSQKFYLIRTTDSFPWKPIYINDYNNHYIEEFETTVTLIPKALNSKISIYKQDTSSTSEVCCSGGYADFENKKIGIYAGFTYGEERDSAVEAAIPFALKAGQQYRLYLKRTKECMEYVTLEDVSTGDTVTAQVRTNKAGRAWGKFSYTVDSGSISVSAYKTQSLANPTPKLAMIGDSFVEGHYLGGSRTSRYASRISDYLNGDVYICAKGAASSSMGVQWFNQYLFETVRPKYILIAFGMNDTNYDIWLSNMQKMISLAEDNGAIPILATIPPNANSLHESTNPVHERMSSWVRRSGFRYIDIAKVLTKSNDCVTVNKSLLVSDYLHPTSTGHKKIYEEFVSSLGDLF